ncbi:Outer membrane receptor proteins, mostly Fe transport [Alteromonadaceae bacterium Bs31]|nr:Outer membrane receptor proteins, mostly Fe transport [Alteromonadaceae bacterium Bs31]
MYKFSVLLSLAVSAVAFAEPLEEIVVTGELHKVGQLRLANSVSVIDAELIESRNAKNLESILSLAPNVNFSSGASRGRFIQIRGIGERSQFVDPVNPSVGIIVDGIDFTGLGTGVSMLDAAQVEIFRGPQGTLYGANALAGMINIVGSRPTTDTRGRLAAGVGNYGSYDVSATVSTALSANIGWRISALKNVTDGYIENDYLGRADTNNIDESTLRNMFTFQLSEHLSVDLTSYLIDIDNGYDAFSLDNNRHTLSDQPGQDRQKGNAHALKANYSGMSFADVEGLLSYADNSTEYGYDEDWSYREICPIDSECAFWQYSTTDNYERDNTNTSLDLRLLSKPDTEGVRWAAGIYYKSQQVDLVRSYVNNDPDYDFYNPISNPLTSIYTSEHQTENLALYGQLEIPLAIRWTLITGLRAENYSADFSDDQDEVFAPEESLWGGRVALEFQANDETLFYGLVSRGYKVGGFNPDPSLETVEKTFDTETMLNYELGIKSAPLPSLTVQSALFYQQRDAIQIKQSRAYPVEGVFEFIDFLDNAPGGANYGLEAEFNWAASDNLALFGSLALLQTEFDRFENKSHVDRNPLTGVGYDMSQRDQAHAPEHQYFLAARYEFGFPLMLQFEIEGKDSFYFSESHNEQSEAYTLFNVRAEYELGNTVLALWMKNITDELTETRGFYFSHDFGNDPRKLYAPEPYTQKGDPQTFGASVAYTF